MILTFVFLAAAAGCIYLSCETFVNGIEWLGRRLGVGQTATGTILAAFGTALPESVVTLVATAFGKSDDDRQIGIGAALGGPLALSTVAYGFVGLCLLIYGRRLGRGRRPRVVVDGARLARDQGWFLALFAAKILLGVTAFAFKPWLGIAFLLAYGIYFRSEMSGDQPEEEEGEDLAPLFLRRHEAEPALVWCLLQCLGAVVVIFVASQVFVGQLGLVGPALGLSPQLTALLLSPLATELPETMNALIWVRQGKERLALANISGAMMIQATVPTALGLFFTPWRLDRPLLIGAAITALATLSLFLAFRRARPHPTDDQPSADISSAEISNAGISSFWLAQTAWFYLLFAALLLWWPLSTP